MYLICDSCGTTFTEQERLWQCPCGGCLSFLEDRKGTFDKIHIASGPGNMWRYSEMLPLKEGLHPVSMGEGLTPLVKTDWSGKEVWFKLDFLCPTGSYKDRGMSFQISKLKELGIERVIEDSSGNAGSSMAAYCARAGITCDIYVPSYTSPGKCVQIEMYGSHLHKIPGTREDTTRAAIEASGDVYYASHNWSPYFVHGVKTFAFEIWEQLGWRAPDNLVVPAGQGSLVMGACLGFRELQHAGRIEKIPRIFAVQAKGCAPLYEAFIRGMNRPVEIQKEETIAEGISSAEPVRGDRVIREVAESGGSFLVVDDIRIWRSLSDLCRKGFYVEPTSAVVGPALDELFRSGKVAQEELTVALLSGSGLKATEKIMKYRDHWGYPALIPGTGS
ncbi:MAG: threonine synthase [Synergistales bacterium]|nr:threonine synthase [Synergistales bacterium]